jgi:hypothetical protein
MAGAKHSPYFILDFSLFIANSDFRLFQIEKLRRFKWTGVQFPAQKGSSSTSCDRLGRATTPRTAKFWDFEKAFESQPATEK